MKREPVVTRSAVALGVSLVGYFLAIFHVTIPGEIAETATNVVYGAVIVGSWAWAAWSARKRVTPVRKV